MLLLHPFWRLSGDKTIGRVEKKNHASRITNHESRTGGDGQVLGVPTRVEIEGLARVEDIIDDRPQGAREEGAARHFGNDQPQHHGLRLDLRQQVPGVVCVCVCDS